MAIIKYIMGIQSFSNMDSGACIVKCSDDGKILDFVAISEERLIRVKYPYVFPVHSVGYCIDYFGLKSLSQIDLCICDHIRIKRWFNSGPTYNISDYDYLKIKFDLDPKKIRIISHHMAHAASTYYASGFDDAAILVVDGNGSDLETTSYFKGEGFKIELIENYKCHGIGACYSAVTKNILNFGTGGEGKTMGLAPYGEKCKRVLLVNAELDGIRNDFSGFMRRMPYSDILNQMSEKNRINPIREKHKKCTKKKDVLNPYFSRAAFDVQQETERVFVHLAKDLYTKKKSMNLCIAGGVGLNSVANKKIMDECEFENIVIFPACSDAGIPFGLAIWGYYNCKELGIFKRKKMTFRNAYTGIEYSGDYISKVLKNYKIPHKKAQLKEVAQHIADGKVVGWFQGGSEYGPRALGHRSILVDSRKAEMRDILNLKVKKREPWRPFAPSILLEHCSEFFDIECESPYMLLIAKVKKPEVIPSVTHIDDTARIQTVTKRDNGIYYDLIKEFYEITGVPCILNTSFNEAGEPIVETPEDAIICYLKSNMECLVVGGYLLERTETDNKEKILKQMTRDREEKISTKRKELLRKYFTGYKEEERDHFIDESNKMAEWYVKYKCKYELEKKTLEWSENKSKILIVGRKDHTRLLPNYINGFGIVKIVGFIPFKDDGKDETKFTYKEYRWEDIKKLEYDEILISSYEYNFEILNRLKKEINDKAIYPIYDNTSRSFSETLTVLPSFKYYL